jgi:hypothetical protein
MNPWCSVLFNLFSVQSGNASRFLFYLTVLSPATFARKGGGGIGVLNVSAAVVLKMF